MIDARLCNNQHAMGSVSAMGDPRCPLEGGKLLTLIALRASGDDRTANFDIVCKTAPDPMKHLANLDATVHSGPCGDVGVIIDTSCSKSAMEFTMQSPTTQAALTTAPCMTMVPAPILAWREQ